MRSPALQRNSVPVRYMLVLWLFVLSAVAYLDRTNISIAGVQIGEEFAIDKQRLGWVFSAFLIGYASFQIPAGLLCRRFGPRLVLAMGVGWWSVFTIATASVSPGIGNALSILILVRLALGAGEATMYPATSQFVERWFPVDERGKANGIIFGGIGIGSGLTPPLVTAIILRYGWRASFWFSALVGAAVGLVWYLAARDTPEQHPLVTEQERSTIAAGRRIPGMASAEGSSLAVPWLEIVRSKGVVALTLSYFSFGYVAWIFFAWFYIYLAQVRGLNLKTSALYSTLPFIAMTIGCLGGGVAGDWIAQRRGLRAGRCLLPAISFAVTAVLLVLGSRAHNAGAAAVILAAGAGSLYIAQSAFFAVAADIAGDHVGVVSGVVNMGGQLGGACTASLTPWVAARFGWEISFVTAASLAVVAALLWTGIDPARGIFTGAFQKPVESLVP